MRYEEQMGKTLEINSLQAPSNVRSSNALDQKMSNEQITTDIGTNPKPTTGFEVNRTSKEQFMQMQ
jgi:hypothetical protein